jgi:hypothetical protein
MTTGAMLSVQSKVMVALLVLVLAGACSGTGAGADSLVKRQMVGSDFWLA